MPLSGEAAAAMLTREELEEREERWFASYAMKSRR